MATYQVQAVRYSGGWVLDIEGEGVTQVRELEHAVQQVRDYLATLHEGRDFSDAVIEINTPNFF